MQLPAGDRGSGRQHPRVQLDSAVGIPVDAARLSIQHRPHMVGRCTALFGICSPVGLLVHPAVLAGPSGPSISRATCASSSALWWASSAVSQASSWSSMPRASCTQRVYSGRSVAWVNEVSGGALCASNWSARLATRYRRHSCAPCSCYAAVREHRGNNGLYRCASSPGWPGTPSGQQRRARPAPCRPPLRDALPEQVRPCRRPGACLHLPPHPHTSHRLGAGDPRYRTHPGSGGFCRCRAGRGCRRCSNRRGAPPFRSMPGKKAPGMR